MRLRYKNTPIVYTIDTSDVPLLKTKTWAVTDEGYAVWILLKEVAKTRLQCANCHAIRSHTLSTLSNRSNRAEISDLKRAKLAIKLPDEMRTGTVNITVVEEAMTRDTLLRLILF